MPFRQSHALDGEALDAIERVLERVEGIDSLRRELTPDLDKIRDSLAEARAHERREGEARAIRDAAKALSAFAKLRMSMESLP
jgi:chromosome segregation ATPase